MSEADATLPDDLNPAGVRHALADVKVKIGGIEVPINEVIALVKCRPGRPADGCQGRGFSLIRKPGSTDADLTACGCAINAWKKANAARLSAAASGLSPKRARQVEASDESLRKRLDRKSNALAEARADLEAILVKVGEAVGSLADELQVASARAARVRADRCEAAEWVINLDQRMAELKKLRAEAETKLSAAGDEEDAAQAEVYRLRAAIETAKGAHAAEERQARARVEKLERRVKTFVSYHPEAAAAAG